MPSSQLPGGELALDSQDRPTHSATLWLQLAVALGLFLRVWEAVESSLWLDELHTLAHASQSSLGAVSAQVARDNHTPLFFWAVHLLGDWTNGAWLRLLPALTSLAVVLPVLCLARSFGQAEGGRAGERAALLAVWLVACLPFQVHYAAMLRPYAWLGLLSAGAVWAAFCERGPRGWRFALFFVCVLAGLWTHRGMALVVLGVGFARLFVRAPGMLGLGWLILAGALAVAPMLPWLASFAGERTTARLEFQEEVGGYSLRPVLVKEVLALPARLFVPYMGILRTPWSWLARGAALVFFSSAFVASFMWVRGRLRGRIAPLTPSARALVLFTASTFVLVAGTSLWSWDRVPLQYFTTVAWALPLIVAVFVVNLPATVVVRGLTLSLMLSALVLGVAQAGGHCTEDMRAAVVECNRLDGLVRKDEGHAPHVAALLSQPAMFEHGLPFRVYSPELEIVEPQQIPALGQPGFERPVILLVRDIRNLRSSDAWESLGAPIFEGRVEVERTVIDEYLVVYLLAPDRR